MKFNPFIVNEYNLKHIFNDIKKLLENTIFHYLFYF